MDELINEDLNNDDDLLFYGMDLPDKITMSIDTYSEGRNEHIKKLLELNPDWSHERQYIHDSNAIATFIHNRAKYLINYRATYSTNETYKIFDSIAFKRLNTSLVRLDTELKKANDYSWGTLQEIIVNVLAGKEEPRSLNPVKYILEAIWIQDAYDYADTLKDRGVRVLLLERILQLEATTSTSYELCNKYLSLASRCYIGKLDTECVCMCRRALESLLKTMITSDHLRRIGCVRDYPSLEDYIDAAFDQRHGFLSSRVELKADADSIRLRGNKAIHGDPDITKDVLDTIRKLVRIVNAASEYQNAI